MRQFFRNFSLSREYYHFAVIVVLITTGVSLWGTWVSYRTLERERTFRYAQEADKVADALVESLNYVEHFFSFIGQKIVASNRNDPSTIASILKERIDTTNAFNTDIFTWTLFDFVNPQGYVTAASTQGAIKQPVKIDKNKRSWMETAPRTPWTLQVAAPDIGVTSGEKIIPVGYGITNTKGTFLGILSIGFQIEKLSKKLERALGQTTSSYLLLSRNGQFITSSSDNKPPIDAKKLTEIRSLIATLPNDTGKLPKAVTLKDSTYRFYRYTYPFPYIVLLGENNFSVEKEFQSIVYPRLVDNLLLGTFFIILLYFFHRFIVRPMVTLSNTARSLSHGKYDTPIPRVNSVEANNLADALGRIKQLMAEIQQFNTTLEQRVAERTKSLQEALASKQEFMNHLGHEVRTPVSSIKTRVELLMMDWDSFTEAEQKEYLVDIEKNSLRLCNLVTNLLDLFKSGAGKMTYTMQNHNIADLAAEIVAECKPLYQHKGLTLTLANQSHHSIAECDGMRMGQVLRNLLTNACRYTAEGTVTLTLYNTEMHRDDGKTLPAIGLAVQDQGIGVPEGELGKIFESFVQSSRTNNKAGGTGLGLAICREIITAHHGQIWAENNKDGQGCTFTVLLFTENV